MSKLIISLEGWSNYVSTEHKGLKLEKLHVYLVELEGNLVFSLETPWKCGELLKKLVELKETPGKDGEAPKKGRNGLFLFNIM